MTTDFEKLIKNLPFFLHDPLRKHSYTDQMIEIILDLGRRPKARFTYGTEYLSQKLISWQDLDYVERHLSKFNNENRAGIEQTLHRVSCIRNRQFLINGLTCRIGRSIFGTVSVIRDLLESKKSILLLGKPGVGKTTIIREIGRVLANEMEKRVVLIDTSNEIAGDSDIPHLGIGRARRMQVPKAELQHQVMIEAIENHMPQVIIIDEIGTELEVLAARTIAEKGVQLIGTTHGNCLENLIKNPLLSDLIGGIQHVTLSDEEAKRRGTQKSILERKAYPAFEIIIEINQANIWIVYENVAISSDVILRKSPLVYQARQFQGDEKIQIRCEKLLPFQNELVKGLPLLNEMQFNNLKTNKRVNKLKKSLVIYSYSISNNFFKEVFFKVNGKFLLTNDLQKSSVIIGLTKHLQQNENLNKFANENKIPIYSFPQISINQLTRFIEVIT